MRISEETIKRRQELIKLWKTKVRDQFIKTQGISQAKFMLRPQNIPIILNFVPKYIEKKQFGPAGACYLFALELSREGRQWITNRKNADIYLEKAFREIENLDGLIDG